MHTNARIDPTPAPTPAASTQDAAAKPTAAQEAAERSARYRLVIEEGPRQGTFIYKTLDSVTGEVVRQLPREEVVKLAEGDRYTAGSVVDTAA